MWKHRICYLAVLAGSLWYFITQQHWLSWVILVWVLAVPLLSLLISLPAMLRVRLSFSCPERALQGEAVRPMLKISHRFPLLRCRIQVQHPMTGDSYLYELGEPLQTRHCGIRKLRIWRLWVYDYLGLFRRKIRGLPDCTLAVEPRPIPPEQPPRLRQSLTGRFRPKNGGFSEHHEMRPYQPGDSLRLIHWKLSAKTDSLLLRQPMTAQQEKIALTLVLSGEEDTLDRKLGQLLWAGTYLIAQSRPHEIRCLTGQGFLTFQVSNSQELTAAIHQIMAAPTAAPSTPMPPQNDLSWQYHIGGDCHES